VFSSADPIRMSWRDYLRRECVLHGRVVRLSPIQTEIIALMLLRRGCAVSSATIIEWLWPNPDLEPETALNTLHEHLYILRAKVPGLIRRFAGRRSGLGYTIDLPVVEQQLAA
jgi:DNA-binding response OmpR family regulator